MPAKPDHGDAPMVPGAGDPEKHGSAAAQPHCPQSFESRPPPRSVLQLLALGASIILAASAVATLLFGVWNYNRNAEAQVQLMALGSLQHYLDLAVEHPDLASRGDDQPVDARYAWFAAEALTTAQTLWILVGQQADWQRSINAIVRQNRFYLRSGVFVCDDFTLGFVSYLRERVPALRCAELGNAQ